MDIGPLYPRGHWGGGGFKGSEIQKSGITSISVVRFRVSQAYLRNHRVNFLLLGLIVTCLQLAQVCTFQAVAHALAFRELASTAALAQQQLLLSSFVRQLSYFQAGRCQPGPGVLVQVGQAPLPIRWPVHCAVVHDVLHRLVWRTTFAFRGGF